MLKLFENHVQTQLEKGFFQLVVLGNVFENFD